MKIRFLLLIPLLFLSISSFSQAPKLNSDSIFKLLAKSGKNDTNKVKLMLEYSRCFFQKNLDTVLHYNTQALEIADKINFGYGIARALNGIAMYYWLTNKPDQAIPTFHKAVTQAEKDKNFDLIAMVTNNLGVYYGKLGLLDSAEKYHKLAIHAGNMLQDRSRYVKAVADLGMIYFNRGNYVDAMQYILEAKNVYEKEHRSYELIVTYNRMGLIYYQINDFNQAMSAYRLGLKVNESLGDINLEMSILQNIGLLYHEVKKDFDSAKIYLTRVLEMAIQNNNQENILSTKVNLGNIAFEKLNFQEALSLYTEAYASPLIPNRIYERTAILVNLATVYLNLGDLKKAEEYVKQGFKLANEQKLLRFEKNAVRTMGDIESRKKNYKKAFEYYVRYSSLLDTLGNEVIKQKVAEAVFQDALKQKETQNALLQMDNELKKQTIQSQWYIIGGVILILILGLILLMVILKNNRQQRALNRLLDRKNKELEELNITKDKFISIIAHDLKSPFNSLLGFLTDMDEHFDDYDEPMKRDIIGKLKKSSHNTYNLLVNLLDWTQSQRGQIKILAKKFPVGEVIHEIFGILSNRANAKQQQLISEVDPGIQIHSDPQIIKAILINLVNNAIKFTPSNGKINVSIHREKNSMRFEVSDTGIGIPLSQIENLFRIDAQYRRLGTENEPGTGLGLVMCREYIKILGGEIGVKTEEGKGSTFYFTIPVNPEL